MVKLIKKITTKGRLRKSEKYRMDDITQGDKEKDGGVCGKVIEDGKNK